MAITQNASYDNATYQAAQMVCLGTLTGASSQTQRFSAFTSTLIKSINITVVTAGTSAGQVINLFTQSGTTTTTTALTTYGSAQAKAGTNVLTTLTLAAGDACWVGKGTDATDVFAVGMEARIVPGASYTP